LNRMPGLALATIDASVALRTKRIAPQIVAVQFDQVEGVEEYAVVSAVVSDQIERGNAVVIAGDRFAIYDAGARAQAAQGQLLPVTAYGCSPLQPRPQSTGASAK
jgi:hypothetical protein